MLHLPAVLTHADVGACLAMQLPALRSEAGAAVEVDASRLVQFDSSALAILLALRREALGLGKTFAVKALPVRLASLAALYGVAELFPS